MKTEITQELLHDLFHYKDGNLYWREDRSINAKAGDLAGTKNKPHRIGINNKIYTVSRLIYLFHYGYFPENKLINLIELQGNKIENLEEASLSCIQSRRVQKNLSKIKGIYFNKVNKHWRAEIKNKVIGCKKDFLEAACLRYAAEQCLGWDRLSESPAAKYAKEHIQGIK